jgi:hypothetical protein
MRRVTYPKEYQLRDAISKFAPRSLKLKLNQTESNTILPKDVDFSGSFLDRLHRMQPYMFAILDRNNARREINSKMTDYLFESLRSGRLIAQGIQTKPVIGHEKKIIPEFLFEDPQIDLEKNAIENFGQRYEGVRIHQPKGGIGSTASLPRASASLARTGRPSKQGEIERAIDAVTSEGIALSQIPRKTARDMVRQKAKELGSNTDLGFSDPVIQRALVARFGRRA